MEAISLRGGQPVVFRQPSDSTSSARTSRRSATRCRRASCPVGSPCASPARRAETETRPRDTVTLCIPEEGKYLYARKRLLLLRVAPRLCPRLLRRPRPTHHLPPQTRLHLKPLDPPSHSWRTASLNKSVFPFCFIRDVEMSTVPEHHASSVQLN